MSDPYRDDRIPREAESTDPFRDPIEENANGFGFMLPLMILVAVVFGFAYYFYGKAADTPAAVRADLPVTDPVTKSAPSPN